MVVDLWGKILFVSAVFGIELEFSKELEGFIIYREVFFGRLLFFWSSV
jgi:hypothetical protein